MENFPKTFAEFLAAARGKTVFAQADAFPSEFFRAENFTFAGTENFAPGKTFFEMLAAPLASAGTPWESARERISRELKFWFGDDSPALSGRVAGTFDEAAQAKISLARALAAKPDRAPLAVSAVFLSREIFGKLRERARSENFAAVVCGKILPPNVFDFDALAIFGNGNSDGKIPLQTGAPEEIFRDPANLGVARKIFASNAFGENSGNVFSGKILGAGAGEFLAECAGKEIHGRLCGNAAERDFDAETPIEIFVRAESCRIDAIPPEENFFEISADEKHAEIVFDGRIFSRGFQLAGDAGTLRAAATSRQALEIPAGDAAFLWFFPEDALGFPVDPAGV